MVESIFRAYSKAYRGLPREIWYLSLALFINRCGTMVLPFLTLYLHEKIGMTEGHAAQMLSVYGLGAIVLSNSFIRTSSALLTPASPMAPKP